MRPAPWLVRGALGLALGCGGGAAAPASPGAPASRTRVPIAEPADGSDGVELATGKGHIEPAAVEVGLAPHRDALASCYTQRVGRRRWLGGRAVLRWDVAADGSLARVVIADSDLGAWSIERCVLAAARAANFGAPAGGAAEVMLPLEFSLCRARAGDPRGACAAASQPALWDDDASARAVGGQLARLDACARGKTPAPDDVQITVYVGARGRAASVGFASPASEIAEAWAACAEKIALGWHLPDPKGQVVKLRVRYRPR